MSKQALPLSTPVAVIGAGAMGAGIAQVAAQAGHPVRLLDNRPGAAEQAVAGIRAQLAKLADKGKLSPEAAQAAAERLLAAASSAELADAGLVIEAIVENLEVKRALFRELEAICGADCIFATNTSSISVTAIAANSITMSANATGGASIALPAGLSQDEKLIAHRMYSELPKAKAEERYREAKQKYGRAS